MRENNVRYICATINSKRLTSEDRFQIALFISELIGIDKIISKGTDCALFLENLSDDHIAQISELIKDIVEKNNERVKNMYL